MNDKTEITDEMLQKHELEGLVTGWGEKYEAAMNEIINSDSGVPGEAFLTVTLAMIEEIGMTMVAVAPDDDAEFGRLVREEMRQNAVILSMIYGKAFLHASRDEADDGQD